MAIELTRSPDIRPVGWRILVKPHEGEEGVTIPEELKNLGFEVKQGMDADEIRRSVLSLDMGTVVRLGPHAWMKQEYQGKLPPEEWKPWAEPGDRIIFGKYAGKLVRDPGEPEYYFLMNDEDVQAVLEGV